MNAQKMPRCLGQKRRAIFDTVSGGRIVLIDSNMMLQGAIEALAQPGDELDMQGRCRTDSKNGEQSILDQKSWR